jgi:hypothetical protein
MQTPRDLAEECLDSMSDDEKKLAVQTFLKVQRCSLAEAQPIIAASPPLVQKFILLMSMTIVETVDTEIGRKKLQASADKKRRIVIELLKSMIQANPPADEAAETALVNAAHRMAEQILLKF